MSLRIEELKGIEYGCTVDAVSLLIPAMQRKRKVSTMPTVGRGGVGRDMVRHEPSQVLVQVDNYGLAHVNWLHFSKSQCGERRWE